MADSNVNRPSSSGQSSVNARDASQASSKPSKIDQSLDEIIASRKAGQISVAQKKKRENQAAAIDNFITQQKREANGPVDGAVVIQKKRVTQDLDEAVASGFSRHSVTTTENNVESHFKRRRLIDITDFSNRSAINFSSHGSGHMTAMFEPGEINGTDLISRWRQQNGGYIPRTIATLTRIRDSSRLESYLTGPIGEVSEEPVEEVEEGPQEWEIAQQEEREQDAREKREREQQQQLKALSAPAPAPLAEKKKKTRKNKSQRRRAREEREELERQAAAQAAASGSAKDAEMTNAPESEGGNGRTGQNPPSLEQLSFAAPAGAPSFSPASVCGNCNKRGHQLVKCPGPVDEDGFVSGCALHNTKEHGYDECPTLKGLPDSVHFGFLVDSRAGLPPIRSQRFNWVHLATFYPNMRPLRYPLTRSFSVKLSEEAIASYDFSQGASVFQLGSDPLTYSFDAVVRNYARLEETESPDWPLEAQVEDPAPARAAPAPATAIPFPIGITKITSYTDFSGATVREFDINCKTARMLPVEESCPVGPVGTVGMEASEPYYKPAGPAPSYMPLLGPRRDEFLANFLDYKPELEAAASARRFILGGTASQYSDESDESDSDSDSDLE
ncbi:hypothetical protein F5Y00DRAFT_273894 [Daldinia vernicosa]|uniref:uncharacterized protein n=1 Tax=Daldinia vernicosa TaxID=114800 RepID=UPI002007B9E1|nr:uncharacterized protein F5Y00DRAFT_273894 [Daldinia vernicosa]KAI0844573.1 hypothetical protein F5Y00DRAFT_273894 [Daldinia vernicosa]